MRTLFILTTALLLPACQGTGSGAPTTQAPVARPELAPQQPDLAPTPPVQEQEAAPESSGVLASEASIQEAQAQLGAVQPTRIGPNVPARPPTWYAVMHLPGPSWRPDVSPFEQPAINEHIEHYEAQRALGKLALGGPFMDEGQGGGLMVLYNMSYEEAVAIAEADPAVRAGTLVHQLRSWFVAMSGE